MKTRKITAALCALAMAVSLSACGSGDKSGTGADKPAETAKAAETTAKKSDETTAKAETTEETAAEVTATAEPEPEPEPEQSFSDPVRKAVKKMESVFADANCFFDSYGIDRFTEVNGKIFFVDTEAKAPAPLYCYDIASNELKTVYNDMKIYRAYCTEDALYAVPEDNKFLKYDLNGDYLKTFDPESYPYLWGRFGDGTLVLNDYGAYVKLLSADMEVIKVFPSKYETEAAHGLTETITVERINNIQKVNGRIFGFIEERGDSFYDDLVYLDEERDIWVKCSADKLPDFLPKEEFLVRWNFDGTGDYDIYDLSTGEMLYQVKKSYYYNMGIVHYGDDFDISYYDGKFYKVNALFNGSSDFNFSEYEPMSEETCSSGGSVISFNSDKYYIYKDKYGIFLRTYEKGEAEEETIMLFN